MKKQRLPRENEHGDLYGPIALRVSIGTPSQSYLRDMSSSDHLLELLG